MKYLLLNGLSLLAPAAALAQAPVLTGLTPLANATAVSRTAPLTATFSQPLLPTSAGALRVFSAQRGGLRTRLTPATVSSNALAFAPAAFPFMPGETVQYTLTTAVAGSGGALAQPRVGQFTTAVGTANTGIFAKTATTPPPVPAQYYASSVALGDVDADGDLDLLIAGNGLINVRLNDGLGTFSGTQEVRGSGTGLAYTVVLGDIDNDGDLDLLASGGTTNVVSVWLNDGRGTFSSGQDVTLPGTMFYLALGDVDADGDLDLAVANTNSPSASVRLNDGSGNFSGGLEVGTSKAWNVTLGDVDNDGDLDLLVVSNEANGTATVYLNNGSGTFSSRQTIATGAFPRQAVLGDLDQDGDLDLLVNNFNTLSKTSLSLYRNDGTGTFETGQSLYDGHYLNTSITLADAEGDGDLDILMAITSIYNPPTIFTIGSTYAGITTVKLLNNGKAAFSAAETITVGTGPHNIAVGDLNGDGGVDFVTSDYYARTATVCLNGRPSPLATRAGQGQELAVFPNPAHRALTLAGASPHAAVQVLDLLGRVVHTALADAAGTAHLVLPVGLPAGSYLVCSGGQVRRLTVD